MKQYKDLPIDSAKIPGDTPITLAFHLPYCRSYKKRTTPLTTNTLYNTPNKQTQLTQELDQLSDQ